MVNVVLCLMLGEKCYWQKFKTVFKQTNHPLELKLCRANFPCSQQYTVTPQELSELGACLKAPECKYVNEQCKLAYNLGAPLLKSRWLFCWGWKQTLKEETQNVPGLGRY